MRAHGRRFKIQRNLIKAKNRHYEIILIIKPYNITWYNVM